MSRLMAYRGIPEATQARQVGEWQLLARRLALLLSNVDAVVENPRCLYSMPAVSRICCCYTGGVYIYLGVLLTLWHQGRFLTVCPRCKGRAYMARVGGSCLTGNWCFHGVCASCHSKVEGPAADRQLFNTLRDEVCDAAALCEITPPTQRRFSVNDPAAVHISTITRSAGVEYKLEQIPPVAGYTLQQVIDVLSSHNDDYRS